ncbi:MAG TPA: DUF2244 domain-containing protein [Xanthomonadales bacterium]|nr:DUF2244 domain-containing protein [Xanthomonadales bacterium]
MIIVENSREGRCVRIQAKSHFSLGIKGLFTLIGTLSALTLLLASVAAWFGYWPILAIAVFQVVLLGMIFVRAWKAAWAVETISINSECIAVLQERYSGHKRTELDVAWARVTLQQPDIRWYSPDLEIRSGRCSVKLGEYLNTAEKRKLAESISRAIDQFSAWQNQ